jgi:hypothetical protein
MSGRAVSKLRCRPRDRRDWAPEPCGERCRECRLGRPVTGPVLVVHEAGHRVKTGPGTVWGRDRVRGRGAVPAPPALGERVKRSGPGQASPGPLTLALLTGNNCVSAAGAAAAGGRHCPVTDAPSRRSVDNPVRVLIRAGIGSATEETAAVTAAETPPEGASTVPPVSKIPLASCPVV